MIHRFLRLGCVGCWLSMTLGYGLAAAAEPPPLGTVIESFQLNDVRGATWSLDDWDDRPVVVVAFLGTECPLVQLYAGRLEKLSRDYRDKGVAFVGVNANQQDSLQEIIHFSQEHALSFPMLKDAGNRLADRLGARRTPEVFVLDRERRLRYHGRIDDQFTYGVQRTRVEHAYLSDALDALLAGREVATPRTEVVGCLIGRVLEPQPDAEVTYAGQISRILNRRCVECHRPGQIGPFALTRYEEAVGWAEMIAEVVRDGRMPPWHANPAHGQFINDARLTDEERDLILRWVRAGAPAGDPGDLPEPPKFVEQWRIGEPDLVVYMADKPHAVPASGEVKYQYFVVDPGFTEDKWVKAAECRPGNRSVVHHIIVAAGSRQQLAARFHDEVVSDWLAATAPGSRPMVLPTGLAKRIPAGSKLVFQMHYTPNGKPQEDRSSIGLIFADPAEVKHEVITQKAANPRFRIPPGDPDYRVEAEYKFAKDSMLLALFPHMHLRGKSFRYTAHFPDGRQQILLDVPRYDFNWQNSYELSEAMRMPAGTRIQCEAHFDNSASNWANPDPTATVRWGDQTWEEMMIGYFNITPVAEVDHRSKPAVRRTQLFLERTEQGKSAPSERLRTAAGQALSSSSRWQQFAAALREAMPQLDRVCWTTLADGRLTVQRVAQDELYRSVAAAGTRVPATGLLLAEHAVATEPVVHPQLAEVTAPDFRLMSRLFGSSAHFPATLGGERGVISFWSTDADGFPPEAVEFLKAVTACLSAER